MPHKGGGTYKSTPGHKNPRDKPANKGGKKK